MSYPPNQGYPGQYPPQQYPPQQYPPQQYPPQTGYPPQQPQYPPQYPPNQYPPQQTGYPPQQYPPQQYPPQQYPPQQYPPQQYPPQQTGYPPQQYPPQQTGYPPQQYPPQTGYPPQQTGYPPQQYPPQPQYQQGPPGPVYGQPGVGNFPPQTTAPPPQLAQASQAVQHAATTAHLYVTAATTAPPPFNGTPDAEALYKAMKGLGTDEKVLTDIIANRTRAQLQEIKKVFEQKYGKTLEKWIKSETSGHYEELLCALIDDKADYDAKMVNHAIKGLGTDDDELIEIICTRTNGELKAMKEAYRRLYGKDAESDVKGDTSGDYRKLLLAILRCERSESTNIDIEQAKKDAEYLYSKGEGKVGTDEDAFIEVLSTRSYPQLHAMNDAYINKAGHSLERGIKSETSGNFKKAMIVILTPRDEYFSTKIRDAIKGVGTKDHQLIREVNYISNSVALCKAVNTFYAHQYKNGVAVDIGGDTSGHYGKTLVAVIKNRTAM